MNSYSKVDVTDRVYGKMDNNQLHFFLDRQEIGYLGNGTEVVLRDGFQYEQDHFYQIFEDNGETTIEQYVSNCDQGWC